MPGARLRLAYLAQWYHRDYTSGAACPAGFDGDMLPRLWQASGWDIGRWVCRAADGRRLWLYSTYVLGGLALRHELSRPDDGFLRRLCRIYYGEALELVEGAAGDGRAIAFARSLHPSGSLWHYLRALLTAPAGSYVGQEAALMERVQAAGREALRRKFRIEWAVRHDDNCFVRYLRVGLAPEDAGGLHHAYLRRERVEAWGLDARQPIVLAGVRLLDADGGVRREPDWKAPLVVFANTGAAEAGFVACHIERRAIFRQVPEAGVGAAEIVLRTPDGKEATADRTELPAVVGLAWSEGEGLWTATGLEARRSAATADFSRRPWLWHDAMADLPYARVFRYGPGGTVWHVGDGEGRWTLELDVPAPVRDCNMHTIDYADADGTRHTVSVPDADGPEPMEPTVTIRALTADGYTELEVWRPTLAWEFCDGGGHVVRRGTGDVAIPYIYKDTLTLRQFGEHGYQSYPARRLPPIASLPGCNSAGGATTAWQSGRQWRADELDPEAPDTLLIELGHSEKDDGRQWLAWDYRDDTEPEPIPQRPQSMELCSIAFADMRGIAYPEACPPPVCGPKQPMIWRRAPRSALKAFDIARRYNCHYFVFQTLADGCDWLHDIYEPLATRGLDEQTRLDLRRLADELGLGDIFPTD